MCYAKPGPRCANHIAIDLNKANTRLAWLNTHADSENAAQMNERDTLAQRREGLLLEFDGTLTGQKKLETAIASMSDGDPDYAGIVSYKKTAKLFHTKKLNAYKKAALSDPSLPSYEASVSEVNVSKHADDASISFPHAAYDVSLPDNVVARYEISYNPEQYHEPKPRDKNFHVRMSYIKYSDTGKVLASDDKYIPVNKGRQDAEHVAQRLALDMKRNYKNYLNDDGLPQM
jgi:hypothetical protein